MWWVSKNCPGYDYPKKPEQMGKSTAKQVHADLKQRYEADHMGPPVKPLPYPDLMDILAYKAAYKAACGAAQTDKGERPDRDPQEGTVEDTMDMDEVIRVLTAMLGSDRASAPRDMSIATWMDMTIGRGDDARLVYLPDLLKPQLVRVIGPCPAFLLSAVLRAGKRQMGGKVQYAGSIRAKDPLQCCHGALGRNFMNNYTLERKPFPSPDDTQLWRHRSPVWLGEDDQANLSYTQQADNQKVYMAEAGVHIRKVTHAWRSHKARDMDEQGVSDDLIARLGRWLRTALNQSYLRFFKPKGLLAAAGFDKDKPDAFFDERFCLDVEDDLVLLVFPWLADLRKKVRDLGDACPVSARGLPALLAYLAVVVVQDACALLSSADPDIKAAAGRNQVHRYLLRHSVFREKLRAYQEKLAAGGYEPLRPLSTREEVQQLHAKLDAMTGIMQRQRDDDLQGLRDQLQQRQPPRSMEDEEYEQERAFAGVLKAAEEAAAAGDDEQPDSDDEPTLTADENAAAMAAGAAAGADVPGMSAPASAVAAGAAAAGTASQDEQQQPAAAQQLIAALQAQVQALEQELAVAKAASAAAEEASEPVSQQEEEEQQQQQPTPTDCEPNSSHNPRRSARQQQQRQREAAEQEGDLCSESPAAHRGPQAPPQLQPQRRQQQQQRPAASAAETVGMSHTAPFQQFLGKQQQQQQQSSFQPIRQQLAAATACSDAAAAAYEGPFRGLMGKVQPARTVTSQLAASGAVGPIPQHSIAEVAAAAAAQAVAAVTGGDHAAVAAAAAQAAAQAAVAGVTAAPAAAAQGQAGASEDAEVSSDEPVSRAMPTPGSFRKFGQRQVQELWKWYVAPYDGGKSVQEMESARPPQIAWRQQQKYGNQRWRQLNLVLQRVHELTQQGSRVLSGSTAAAAVDQERISLGLELPKYVKHLEGKAAERNAAAAAAVGQGADDV